MRDKFLSTICFKFKLVGIIKFKKWNFLPISFRIGRLFWPDVVKCGNILRTNAYEQYFCPIHKNLSFGLINRIRCNIYLSSYKKAKH